MSFLLNQFRKKKKTSIPIPSPVVAGHPELPFSSKQISVASQAQPKPFSNKSISVSSRIHPSPAQPGPAQPAPPSRAQPSPAQPSPARGPQDQFSFGKGPQRTCRIRHATPPRQNACWLCGVDLFCHQLWKVGAIRSMDLIFILGQSLQANLTSCSCRIGFMHLSTMPSLISSRSSCWRRAFRISPGVDVGQISWALTILIMNCQLLNITFAVAWGILLQSSGCVIPVLEIPACSPVLHVHS